MLPQTVVVPTLKPRNRIVIFRLTQDEYDSMRDVCALRGAKNISDFARSALLTSIGCDDRVVLDQRLAALEATVQRMTQLLEEVARQCSDGNQTDLK